MTCITVTKLEARSYLRDSIQAVREANAYLQLHYVPAIVRSALILLIEDQTKSIRFWYPKRHGFEI